MELTFYIKYAIPGKISDDDKAEWISEIPLCFAHASRRANAGERVGSSIVGLEPDDCADCQKERGW